MPIERLLLILVVGGMTIVSGLADSQGFIHSARVWQAGRLVWAEVGWASLGYGIGITIYWWVIKYMQELGIVSAEIQSTLWFAATIIGVGVVSGRFLHWQRIDQLVGLAVLAGLAWLLVRTGG